MGKRRVLVDVVAADIWEGGVLTRKSKMACECGKPMFFVDMDDGVRVRACENNIREVTIQ